MFGAIEGSVISLYKYKPYLQKIQPEFVFLYTAKYMNRIRVQIMRSIFLQGLEQVADVCLDKDAISFPTNEIKIK